MPEQHVGNRTQQTNYEDHGWTPYRLLPSPAALERHQPFGHIVTGDRWCSNETHKQHSNPLSFSLADR